MMRRAILLLLLCLFYFSLTGSVRAHLSGPPFVKLNGIYAQTNPIATYTQPQWLSFGTDLASPSAYIVNQSIEFTVDEQFFPNPYAYDPNGPKPEYRWDFGDATPKMEGKTASHTYTKAGTYFPNLEVRFPGKIDAFQGFNPMQINILPHPGYVLPQAVLQINNEKVDDPARDILEVRKGRSITFDARLSTGDIISYDWDFSDASSASGNVVNHTFKTSDYFPMFPFLRVTDKEGIVSDTFVFLDEPRSTNPFISLWIAIEDFFVGLFQRG